jgi:hypothetical protein
MKGCLRELNNDENGNRYTYLKGLIKKYEIDILHFASRSEMYLLDRIEGKHRNFRNKTPLSEILIKNFKGSVRGNDLKKRLYEEGLKPPICELCGQDENWKTGKISLQSPFAFSFWAKIAGDEHPFPHFSQSELSNAIRFIGFGYNTDGGNGGNSFQILTESWTDKRIKARFLLGTSSSSNREIIGPSGDVNFQLTNEYKHIFVWYDGTTLGMTINNQYTITKTNSNLLNFNTSHNSDFFIGGLRNTHLNETSWRTNKHYMRDLRWYNGYIPNTSERLQLYNHGLLQL